MRKTIFDNGTEKLEHIDATPGNPAVYVLTIQTPAGPSETIIPDPLG